MPHCPACGSNRVVIIVGTHRRAFCTVCSSRWWHEEARRRTGKRKGHPSIWGKTISPPPR